MDIALFALFAAAFIGFIGPRGSDAKVLATIFFPIGLLLFATLAGYVLGVNPTRILALVGIASVVFVVWALLSPSKDKSGKPRTRT
jgi:hypothetical protein